ncbi:MAG: LamG domain-containing protein [Lachnospiraceae bacterium]|nr:LamG domain-containing protein [Lachnospiraceae bacterium]
MGNDNGVKGGTGGMMRRLVPLAAVLLMAAVFVYAVMENRSQQNSNVQDSVQTETGSYETAVSVALPGLEPDEPEVDSSKEIVNDILLSNVPKADYSYSFNGKLTDAVVVTRAGDEDGFNAGAYPEAAENVLPLFTQGVEGDAIYLDGSYGVELLGIEALTASYTISFWFRAEELQDWSPFLVIGSHLMDVGGSQSFLSFNKKTTEEGEVIVPVFNTIDAVWDNACEVRPSMDPKQCIFLNEWNYITICVNADEATEEGKVTGYLYLNSEMIGSGEVSCLNLDPENVKAYLGINCFDKLFRASYDEIHIWQYVLDESQISAMYAAYLDVKK